MIHRRFNQWKRVTIKIMLTVVFGFISLRNVLFGVLLFVVTFSINLAIVSFILVKIPATYFQKGHDREFWKDKSRPSVSSALS